MLKKIAIAAIAVLANVGVAQAAPFVLNSDTAFNTWAADNGFVKVFGGNVRWGNGANNGDWEYSVVNGADNPLNQQQHAWSAGPNPHSTNFTFNATTGATTLSLVGIGNSSANFLGANINTLFIRAAANDGQTASMVTNLLLKFADGSNLFLGDLLGDSDAQWIGIVDSRIAQGFNVTTASANLDSGGTGRGSRPMYQFKVGHSEVPEPAVLGLVAAGLLGAGTLSRRRRA